MSRRFLHLMVALVLLSILLEIAFFDPHHVHFAWHLPGFDALIGFTGCIGIISAAKWLGKHFLQRKETYYEDEKGENILKKVMVSNHD